MFRARLFVTFSLLVAVGCSGSTEETSVSSTSVVSTSSTSTTTTIPPLVKPTSAGLETALPAPEDVPVGWTTYGGGGGSGFVPETGDGKGYCGGPNRDQRALNAAAIAVWDAQGFQTPYGYFYSSAIAFEDEDSASNFVASTKSQSQCAFYEYEQTEAEFDGFGGDFVGENPWTLTDTVGIGNWKAPEADEAFGLLQETEFTTIDQDVRYGGKEITVMSYERYGRIVVQFSLYGQCCLVGYNDISSGTYFEPTFEDLVIAVDAVRTEVITRLRGIRYIY